MPGRWSLRAGCLAAVLAVAAPVAAAGTVRLNLGRVEYRGFAATGVAMQLSLAGGEAAPLVISIQHLQFGSVAVLRRLRLNCGKARLSAVALRCSNARFSARDPAGGEVRGLVSAPRGCPCPGCGRPPRRRGSGRPAIPRQAGT
jgi:hypothetical protein